MEDVPILITDHNFRAYLQGHRERRVACDKVPKRFIGFDDETACPFSATIINKCLV